MNKPHKHAKYIKAWADGETIQYWNSFYSDWKDVINPVWGTRGEYRIKPREFEEGAWYPTVDKLGTKAVKIYNFGQFGGSSNSGTHPLGDFAWIGEKLEIEWPEDGT